MINICHKTGVKRVIQNALCYISEWGDRGTDRHEGTAETLSCLCWNSRLKLSANMVHKGGSLHQYMYSAMIQRFTLEAINSNISYFSPIDFTFCKG